MVKKYMIWNKKFDYPPSIRSLINDQRHYDIGEEKLPSVTTILQATQSPEEKKAILAKWKQNVGEIKADQIRDTAAARGTVMHRIIEGYLTDEGHVDLSDMGQLAGQMAQKVFKDGLKGSMEEIWGSEITLYYPGLYAGATDLVGIYEGRESIIDFKQSNKPKRREWIEDYFTQLAAYATAHNHVYDTKIQSGVILMCTPNMYFQKFVVSDDEFQGYMWKWLKRVDEFCNRDRLHENEGSLQKSE
jgi:ATP-dependent exoDNAse (exonuclease V) beta subunit